MRRAARTPSSVCVGGMRMSIDGDVRLERADRVHQVDGVLGLGDDLEAGVREHARDALAHEGRIVGDRARAARSSRATVAGRRAAGTANRTCAVRRPQARHGRARAARPAPEREGCRVRATGPPPAGRRPPPRQGAAMFNPMRPELALALHRERVDEGLRRAARSSGQPPDPRRRRRRRFRIEVAYGVNRHHRPTLSTTLRDGAPLKQRPVFVFRARGRESHSCVPVKLWACSYTGRSS